MKRSRRALSGALALLLSLSLVLPCLAQEDADSIAPEAALSAADTTVPEAAPETADDSDAPEAAPEAADDSDAPEAADGTSEAVLKTEDEGEGDSAPSQDAYILPVQSGMDISNALSDAMDNHPHIVIPEGTYSGCSISFRGVPDVTIEAQGATIQETYLGIIDSTSKIVLNGGIWNNAFVKASRSSNFELRPERLTIDGNERNGLEIQGSENITLKNIVVKNSGNNGIEILYSTGITLIKPTVEKSYHFGVAVRSGSTVTIEGGKINANGQRPRSSVDRDDAYASGLSASGGSKVTVRDTELSNNTACGVALNSTEDDETFTCVNLYGVQLLNNGDHGVGCNPYGIVNLDRSDKQRSLVKGNAHNGVQVIDSSSSDFIRNTDFRENGQDGLSIAKKSTVKLVENCTLSSNKKHGMMVRQDSVVKKVNKCTFSSNKMYGIYVNCESGKKATSVNITNSTLNKNTKDGLKVTGKKSSASVKKSTFKSNKNSGVNVYDGATLTELSGSKLTGNSRYGVCVYSKGSIKKASGNTISGNKKKQVYLAKGVKSALKAKK